MTPETWKEIPGYPGYEASDRGRVRSYRSRWGLVDSPAVLAPQIDRRSGHVIVRPRDGHGRRRTIYVSRLVCLAWCRRPRGVDLDELDASHKDGDPSHNAASNLLFEKRDANLQRLFRFHGGRPRNTRGQFSPAPF